MQLVHRPGETQLSGSTKSKKAGNPCLPGLVFVESTQIDNEQLMTSGTLGKIHLQLRRLNNDASVNLPDNVTATVIPTGCSRVLFHFHSSGEGSAPGYDLNGSAPAPAPADKPTGYASSLYFFYIIIIIINDYCN